MKNLKGNRRIRRAICLCCSSARLIAGRAVQGRRGVAVLTVPGREAEYIPFSSLTVGGLKTIGGHKFVKLDIERVRCQID